MDFLPIKKFDRCADLYGDNHRIRSLNIPYTIAPSSSNKTLFEHEVGLRSAEIVAKQPPLIYAKMTAQDCTRWTVCQDVITSRK